MDGAGVCARVFRTAVTSSSLEVAGWAPKWAIGAIVEARWRDDDQWYPAQVEGVDLTTTTYSVVFLSYGNQQDETQEGQTRPCASPDTGAATANDSPIAPMTLPVVDVDASAAAVTVQCWCHACAELRRVCAVGCRNSHAPGL